MNPGPVKTTIIKKDLKYQLYVDGKPFYIKGAGLEFGSIQELAVNGGNAFRTWRVENGRQSGREVLDEAQRQGLKVMMGIEVGRERHGFDYDDEEAVLQQLDRIREEVSSLKDHPALIIWCIGNELNLHAENMKVWDAVNDISKMIHRIDPNHLTTTPIAGINKTLVQEIVNRAPDLDILSVQLYGEIDVLPQLLPRISWKGPIIVSEWGATGYWEVAKTPWDAPIEENSTEKAEHYLQRYQQYIAPLPQCLGSFVFLWGQKQERTSTWFSLYTAEGNRTETVDVMHYLWNEQWPANRCPRIGSVSLGDYLAGDAIYLKPDFETSAMVTIDSNTGDLTYKWEVLRESDSTTSGGDFEEVPEKIPGCIIGSPSNQIKIKAPTETGPYRLYVYVFDPYGSVAHANVPFYVR